MTSRVRPESKEELEARTKKMRERRPVTSVRYSLSCVVEHEGISAVLKGGRGEPIELTVKVPQAAAPPREFTVPEGQLEALIEFLKFAHEECATMRNTYDEIDDSKPT